MKIMNDEAMQEIFLRMHKTVRLDANENFGSYIERCVLFAVEEVKKMGMIEMTSSEKELLNYMNAAPAIEIHNMVPSTQAGCVIFLGLPEGTLYNSRSHYLQVLAKTRRAWAQAMIKEATEG